MWKNLKFRFQSMLVSRSLSHFPAHTQERFHFKNFSLRNEMNFYQKNSDRDFFSVRIYRFFADTTFSLLPFTLLLCFCHGCFTFKISEKCCFVMNLQFHFHCMLFFCASLFFCGVGFNWKLFFTFLVSVCRIHSFFVPGIIVWVNSQIFSLPTSMPDKFNF